MDVKVYLALGDSMSIDDYTGVEGGGAVKQFFTTLGAGWRLDDRTLDGCQMADVPRDGRGDLITLTVGGNDLLWRRDEFLREGVAEFAAEHAELLAELADRNPDAALIVGDVYAPAAAMSDAEVAGLAAANVAIRANCRRHGATLAPIHEAFRGREAELLCLAIEPTLAGAVVIANLFAGAYRELR
jgi:lysophospholipase L1-like esterase